MFYSKKLECVLVGLENAGKTTLLNVLASGVSVETCPTIGLNVKLVKKSTGHRGDTSGTGAGSHTRQGDENEAPRASRGRLWRCWLLVTDW